MNSIASPSPTRKPNLTITSSSAEPGAKVLVSIGTSGQKQTDDYWFERIACQFGIAVHVSKIWDGKSRDFAYEEYDVLIDGQHSTCESWGQLRWGNRHPCRHIMAAIQLLAEGKLTLPPRPEHAPERPAKL